MNFVNANARLLYQLQMEGFVPASNTKSVAATSLFGHLQQAGIVRKRRKGGGNQFQLDHPEFLQAFILQTYPEGLFRTTEDERLSRVQGVMRTQDSKNRRQLDFSLLHVRGTAVLQYVKRNYDLAALTDSDTSICLKISADQQCSLIDSGCTILTVENPTAFVVLEQIVKQTWQLAVYTSGKMSEILLQQLKSWSQQGHRLVHFGDYDYVGLLEFARILRLDSAASIYYPETLEQLLQRYGNSQLLQKQTSQHLTLLETMRQLPDGLGKQQLFFVYQLLQRTAKGLEQEGLYQ
ncbi:MAG: DUF2220 family protein [Thiolinea sp.]